MHTQAGITARRAGADNLEDIERFFRQGRQWLKKQHEQGISGAEFCRSHSELMDTVIRRLFRRALHSPGTDGRGLLALLAMGGYGRKELSPSSDIDLLFLHFPGDDREVEEWIRLLLNPLWDWGLTVGYTVQTPKDIFKTAGKDLSFFFSLLDLRWLAGDRGDFLQWEEEFSRNLLVGRETEAILQIRQRSELRHKRYGDSVFVLEPEVKEGKGGLRDYHSALWAVRLKHRSRLGEEIPLGSILAEREWQPYSRALSFLWRVRHRLHYLHGRREDRLSFEDQEAVAEALGYRGGNSQAATESFLKDYFTHALQLYRHSVNLLEKCLNDRVPAKVRRMEGPPEIAPGYFLYQGKLGMNDPPRFDRDPFQLWQPWAIVHSLGVEMEGILKESIAGHLDSVNERFRTAEESVKFFLSFLEKPGHLVQVLEGMHETGFLRRFIPEFDPVHCHIQYDRYHIYPVDVHSIYAVRELESLEKKKGKEAWPLLGQLMGEVKDPGLLKLAALLHDLGKAEGGSHAQRGEKIAASIAARLRLSPERSEMLRFLIREHLTFAEVAQRRDLSDENFIFRFARAVEDKERLKMLYLLCFADLRAVGPSAWTVWKDTLMRELFLKTLHLLERGEGLGKESQDQMVHLQAEIMELLQGQVPPPRISEYLIQVPLRHYGVNDAASIGQQILMAERLAQQSVVLEGEEKPEEGCDEITVVARDAPGLFARISGVMTANHLNILSAQISTWESGIAVDRFRVQSLIDEGLFQTPRWEKLQRDMQKVIEAGAAAGETDCTAPLPLLHRIPSSRLPSRVDVDNTSSDFYTIVEIYTYDRPGLLCRISQKIFEMDLNIWMARISTKADQVVDVFYVQDLSGAKLEEEERIASIKKELLEEL